MASDSTTPTSSPSKADRNVANEAFNYLVQGKRHLLVRDIPSAVGSLQKACQLLTGHYGELGNECGDAYFYYGKALFEQAREETGVLGNAIEEQEQDDDDDDDDDEEDGEDEQDKQQDDGEEQEEEEEEEEEEEQSDKSEELLDEEKESPKNEESNNSEAQPAPAPSTDLEPQPGTSAGGSSSNNKDEEEEEITNLQLAWEVLELAKVIYGRQAENSREIQLKLADVHLQLGEVSLESGNFSEAIEDMERCLRIQEELLPSDDRRIAESHYHLGIAYTYNNAHDPAIQNFQRSCEVIDNKIASLKQITAGKDVQPGNLFVNEDDPVAVAQRDIDELTAILPEIREKISDMDDAKRMMTLMNIAESNGAEESAAEKLPTNSSSAVAAAAAAAEVKEKKPITNIGHLVKRKRKLGDDEAEKSTEAENKKSRPDSTLQFPGTSSSSSSLCAPSDEVTESAAAVENLITSQNECGGVAESFADNELPSSSGSTITITSSNKVGSSNAGSTAFDDPVSSSTDCRSSRWPNVSTRQVEATQSGSRDTWNGEISQSETASSE